MLRRIVAVVFVAIAAIGVTAPVHADTHWPCHGCDE